MELPLKRNTANTGSGTVSLNISGPIHKNQHTALYSNSVLCFCMQWYTMWQHTRVVNLWMLWQQINRISFIKWCRIHLIRCWRCHGVYVCPAVVVHYLALQLDEYFLMYFVSFCLVISLPLTKEDAFQQDGPKLHHRFLLEKCSRLWENQTRAV